jgi:hypothetical protein
MMQYIAKKIKWINWYAPYLGAGISIKSINNDFTKMEVQLKMRWYNRNLVGTHLGGYIVWDKAASIQFKKPGTHTVTASFEITFDKIAFIKNEIDTIGKKDYHFKTCVMNEQNEVIAEVEKIVYVRKKDFVFGTK